MSCKPPNFVAPKKRVTGKRGAGQSSHADFIKTVQGQGRSPATSPSDEDLERSASRDPQLTGEGPLAEGRHAVCPGEDPLSAEGRAGEDPLLGERTPDYPLGGETSTEHSRSPSIDGPRRKKKVNICTENSDDPLVVRTGTSSSSVASRRSDSELNHEPGLTLTGTIKRGRKSQNVDVRLNMSREELEVIALPEKQGTPCCGLHVLLLSLMVCPLVFLAAAAYTFYLGTMTWYNMLTHFSSGASKVPCSRVLLPPLLILSYPFLIVLTSAGLGVYSAVVQISRDFARWRAEVQDLEKGFLGWLCAVCRLDECCPYDIVIIVDVREDKETEIA